MSGGPHLPPPADQRRRAAEDRGRRAETLAVLWLRLKGYRILARRARTPVGEIDLILRRGRVVVFTEVKTRGRLDEALSALTLTQCRRIERAARWWMAQRTDLKGCDWRFDLVAIGNHGRPHHLPDAWRPPA